MRLTLRTLLAYRDRVLNAGDREDLHVRVQKSEAASNLLRRIDAVAARKNVGAPKALGKGLGSDANSVSEYLDDCLPAAQVPEMEVICLNSDTQLAELAQCHTILSTAVSQKVDVPQSLYDRIAEIKPTQTTGRDANETANGKLVRVDQAHVDGAPCAQGGSRSEAVDVTVPMVASAGTSITPKGLDLEHNGLSHEVPQYLVGSNRGVWLVPLAIGGLLALLCVLLWQTLGPWDRVAALFSDVPAELPAQTTPSRSPDGGGPQIGTAPLDDESNDTSTPSIDENAGEEEGSLDLLVQPGADSGTAADDGTGTMVDGPPPSDSGDTSSSFGAWVPENDTQAQAVILLRDGAGTITRLLPSGVIGIGNQVVMPTGFSATLKLPGGLEAKSNSGSSVFTLVDSQVSGVPEMDVGVCRLVLSNTAGQKKAGVVLTHPNRPVELSIADNARVSIECSMRLAKAGAVNEPGVYKQVRVFLALTGNVVLRDLFSKETIALQTGEGVAFVQDEKARKFNLQRIPAWLRSDSVRPIDRLAAADLDSSLDALLGQGEQVRAALAEIQKSGRPETAAMATSLRILLGDMPAVVNAVGNPRLSPHWRSIVGLALERIAADPAAAFTSLTDSMGDVDGKAAFDQLCGPGSQSIEDAGLETLIAGLESKELMTRVLSIHHLVRQTGMAHGYLPHRPKRDSITLWRRDLTSDRVELKQVVDIVIERKPL